MTNLLATARKYAFIGIVGLSACGSEPAQDPAPAPEAPAEVRVVTLGPAITEIALTLSPDLIVGADEASTIPAAAEKLPKIGYTRDLSAEGILSLQPTLILATEDAGPPDRLEQVRGAGVEIRTLAYDRSPKGVESLISQVGSALNTNAEPLKKTFQDDCGSLPKLTEASPTALFVYARGAGTLNVSGTGTAGDAMLALAGLRNTVTAYDGYKPLTPEAAVAANPDWLILTTHGLEGLGGTEGLAQIPGLAQLPAVKAGKVAAIDDLQLLAFGLGTCNGAQALHARTRTP